MIEIKLNDCANRTLKRDRIIETELTYPDVILHKNIFFRYAKREEKYDINGNCIQTIFVYRQCRGAKFQSIRFNPDAQEGVR